jgi:hypothetical protein
MSYGLLFSQAVSENFGVNGKWQSSSAISEKHVRPGGARSPWRITYVGMTVWDVARNGDVVEKTSFVSF